MAFVTADRTADTTTTVGTSPFVVSGTAPIGSQTFSAVMSVGDTCYYSAQHRTLNEWEVGLGTYSSANTLTRTTIYSSSNAGFAVTFSAGIKDVFITMAASRSVQIDGSGQTINSGGTYTRTTITATAGQTSFTANYTVNYVEVYVNGILLNSADYTATTGTTVVLASAAAAGDIVDVLAINIGTFTGGVTITGTPTNGQIATWTGSTSIQGGASPTTAGNVLFTADGSVWSSTQKIVRGTSVSASGTAVDFTSIPSWVKRVIVMLNGVSTSGTSIPIVQIGSGSVTTTGYLAYAGFAGGTNTAGATSSTVGFPINSGSAANTLYITYSIFSYSGNIYFATMSGGMAGTTNQLHAGGGNVTLSGALDRVRVTTTNGTDTFDAGSINILYE